MFFIVFLSFGMVRNPLRLPQKDDGSTSKNGPNMWCVLHMLTSQCASRHSCVQFFNISTSKSGPNMVFLGFSLWNLLRATATCTFSTSQLPKVVRDCQFLTFLALSTCEYSSCHSGMHFFSTSQLPKMFWEWGVLQPRGLFEHLNFLQCSDAEVFFICWLLNVLRATTACSFWILKLPKAFREWCVVRNVLRASAACIFFVSHLPWWLGTRRFSEPTFRASGATKPGKNTVFGDFSTFSHTCIFFLLTLSLVWLFIPLLLHLSIVAIVSEVWLLNFLRSLNYFCACGVESRVQFTGWSHPTVVIQGWLVMCDWPLGSRCPLSQRLSAYLGFAFVCFSLVYRPWLLKTWWSRNGVEICWL